ncbi:hypothetical protein NL676_034021 [Syzygium grande]|nr:hypothetical protein NL676_034021 [Syzygium grande]
MDERLPPRVDVDRAGNSRSSLQFLLELKSHRNVTSSLTGGNFHTSISNLINIVPFAHVFAIVPNAVVERTMVVPLLEGREDEDSARSTIRTWMVWLGMHVPETEALMHRTRYCLPQDAPLSHIPSPENHRSS